MRPQEHILEVLRADPRWHFGLEIARATRIGRASIYLVLSRLHEKGLVERKQEAVLDGTSRLPRFMFRIKQ